MVDGIQATDIELAEDAAHEGDGAAGTRGEDAVKQRLEDWARTASRGDVFVYHTGLLGLDREQNVKKGEKPDPVRAAIDAKGCLAYRLYEDGQVFLTQKRIAPYRFEYRAVKT